MAKVYLDDNSVIEIQDNKAKKIVAILKGYDKPENSKQEQFCERVVKVKLDKELEHTHNYNFTYLNIDVDNPLFDFNSGINRVLKFIECECGEKKPIDLIKSIPIIN